MSKATNTKGKQKGRKISTPTIVAITTAVIGCFGTVCASMIVAFVTLIEPIDISQYIQLSGSSSSAQEPADWSSFVAIDHYMPCATMDIPSDLTAGSSIVPWIEQNGWPHLERQELLYAPFLEYETGTEVNLRLTISNAMNSGEWISLSNKVIVAIRRIANVPAVSELARPTGCGGEGYYRYFTSAPLRSDIPDYRYELSSEDADYYTLQPGEPEIFLFTLTCQAPGVYAVDLIIPSTVQGRSTEIVYSGIRGIICPQTANLYLADPGMDENSLRVYETLQYRWTGSSYQIADP